MVVENLMYPLASLLCIAAITEAVVETVKMLLSKELTSNGKQMLSIVIAIVLSLTLNVSIFNSNGIAYYVGVMLSGMIASRGSNYIHSLANVLEIYTKKK